MKASRCRLGALAVLAIGLALSSCEPEALLVPEAEEDPPIQADPPPKADLYFASTLQVQDTLVGLGEDLLLTGVGVTNGGEVDATFFISVYSSQDDELSPDDVLLAETDLTVRAGETVDFGEPSGGTRDLRLGRQYLIMALDRDDAVDENNEENNLAPLPFHLFGLALDVEVQGVGAVEASPEAGAYGYPFNTEVMLAAEPAEGWGFQAWSTPGGTSTTNPLTFTMQADLTLAAVFAESDPRADLRFASPPVVAEGEVKPGDRPTLADFTVQNVGAASASVEVRMYASPHAFGAENDSLLARATIELDPGEEHTFTDGSLGPEASMPPFALGERYIGIVIDPANEVDERDETNNVAVVPFTVTGFEARLRIVGGGQVTAHEGTDGFSYLQLVAFEATPDAGWMLRGWDISQPEWHQFGDSAYLRVTQDFDVTARFIRRVDAPEVSVFTGDRGRADVTWSFTWPCYNQMGRCLPSAGDVYEVQETNHTGLGARWRPIFDTSGTRASPMTHSYRPDAGAWWVRVRARGDDFESEWSAPIRVTR